MGNCKKKKINKNNITNKICEQCNGSGLIPCNICKGTNEVVCNWCDGSGYVLIDSYIAKNCKNCSNNVNIAIGFVKCPYCINGRLICNLCFGKKKISDL